jgi:hypothetical protein
MSSLVHFLAAGVNGALNGSATFLLRGTASSAAAVLYSDFEGTTQPGTNVIALDANGAAEVYCDAYVDVIIRNSAGTILRTVTVGTADATVEVQSTAFTGTDYDGTPSNTAGEPITLRALLNKWLTSAGAVDFKVSVGGVATDLDEAIASFSGLFFNVKSPEYGAEGDGVTDDTAAVTGAIADVVAAGGGIVFFPPGTYVLDDMVLVSAASITFMGCGPSSSILQSSGTASLFNFQSATTDVWKVFRGLGFSSLATPATAIRTEDGHNLRVIDCHFDATNFSNAPIDLAGENVRADISNSSFLLGATTNFGIVNSEDDDTKDISVSGCFFKIPASFTGKVIRGGNFQVTNCTFDASSVTSGAYYMVDAAHHVDGGTYVGLFTNNKFIDGGSSGFVFLLDAVATDSDFTEDCNDFIGFAPPSALTDPGHIYDYSNGGSYDTTSRIHLGSRRGKQLNFTNSAAGGEILGIECFLVADTIVITQTDAANTIYYPAPGEKPIGLDWTMVVLNNSGGARDISFGGSSATVGQTAVADGGKCLGRLFTYQESAGASLADVISTAKTST